ncbi:MAG: molybdopterin molybdotransferase MoeA [Deltaproteobacteria bacterium]|nr:molybdopterin molybdotransferase MoeA [Deltaproteobacteria bacterium]MBW2074756.1 molybdopterin molybdotransferase MoeA [Deltaproteobacteria bacterium]RLB81129.1 MAG: molybdopterin molybdenumtransferase MoeA [Deltaproteobacteria bacterium]
MTEKEFFKVTTLGTVLELTRTFPCVSEEVLPIDQCVGRILSQDIVSKINLPGFTRATMDGYAVQARSTFGASESMPALFTIVGAVEMGQVPTVSVKDGEAVRIATGGMLPNGADSVVMVEHTQAIDEYTLEVFKSVAPLQHVIEIGEDIRKGEKILSKGSRIRPQEMGVLAALGQARIPVFRQPVIAIISSGDEVVPIGEAPSLSQVRDVNAYTLTGLVRASGGIPVYLGIAKDNFEELNGLCRRALAEADMVLISGGSSVGSRDFTVEVVQALPDAEILVHGVSISPGKPTILARSEQKAIWGLPGQVASAMVVFHVMVRPMLERIGGVSEDRLAGAQEVAAVLSRNLASVQGREDYVRVKLVHQGNQVYAEPILGKSGLIHTMVKADGLIRIDMNSEGLEKGTPVKVLLF